MSARHVLMCDERGCPGVFFAGGPYSEVGAWASVARRDAQKVGWRIAWVFPGPDRDIRDYCPAHEWTEWGARERGLSEAPEADR